MQTANKTLCTTPLRLPQRIGGAAPVSGLWCRSYNAEAGRFVSMDPLLGDRTDPRSLNKYLYAAADPVNNLDPSGKDFTLSTAMMVGAITGGILGGIGGATYSVVYQQNDFLSWATLKSALLGAVGGAAVGALLGAATFAATGGSMAQLLPTLRAGASVYFQKWFGLGAIWNHPKTLTSGAVGFGSGLVVGWYYPDVFVGLGAATSTAVTFLTDILARGIADRRHDLFPTLAVPSFAHSVLHFINNYVAGSTFLLFAFSVGFSAGYVVGSGARLAYDAIGKK